MTTKKMYQIIDVGAIYLRTSGVIATGVIWFWTFSAV